MCDFITPLLAAGAAGATATTGTLLAASTALSVAAPLIGGIQQASAARQNAQLAEQQAQNEAALYASRASRERQQFTSQIAAQRAELLKRGVQLDGATAMFLGQTAARERSFNEQSILSTGQARQSELSAEARTWRARSRQALFNGTLSAAGAYLQQPPEQWAELLS